MKRNIIKIESKAVIVTTAPIGDYIGNELCNRICWDTGITYKDCIGRRYA